MRVKRVLSHMLCTVGLLVLLASPPAAIGQEGSVWMEPATAAPVNRGVETSAAQGVAGPLSAHAAWVSPASGRDATVPWAFEFADEANNINDIRTRSLAIDAAGQPHVVYAGEYLGYGYQDGASWQMTKVDPNAASCPALALDGSGRPHIVYYVGVDYSLRYAVYDGSDWVVTTVRTDYNQSHCPSLALDSLDRPHLSTYPAWAQWGVKREA